MKAWLMKWLKSRKFWLTVLSVLVPILNKKLNLNLSTEEVATIVIPILALLLGIAIEDHGEKQNPAFLEIAGSRKTKWLA